MRRQHSSVNWLWPRLHLLPRTHTLVNVGRTPTLAKRFSDAEQGECFDAEQGECSYNESAMQNSENAPRGRAGSCTGMPHSFITQLQAQLKAQGPSRTCHESKEEGIPALSTLRGEGTYLKEEATLARDVSHCTQQLFRRAKIPGPRSSGTSGHLNF